MSTMKKALFLVIATISVGLAAFGWAQAVELKLAHFMPPVHVQHLKNFTPFAENVAKLSNGQVTVKIYPGEPWAMQTAV
jgi:TRAP-type C4-dicarboxylate transport system substrate-binding protein